MGRKIFNLRALFIAILSTTGWAQQETADVRLTRIEESIKATNQHIDELAKGLNQRIDDVNRRIDDSNQRIEAGFDRQTNLLIAVMGLLATAMGVVVWFARQERPIGKKHYDKLLQQDKALGDQFDDLEKELESRTRRSTQQERRHDELAQKLRELEAEIAALKRPAT